MENVGLSLKIDDEIRRRNGRREHVKVALVEFKFLVVEIDVGEDFVFFEKKIADNRNGAVFEMRFEQAAVAFIQKIHLRAESSAGFLIVELG